MPNFLSNYPDIITTALIPMIIAIFALGFPLLLQTITRIDEKYKSTILIKSFRKDGICTSFLWILLSSIISYTLWILQLPPLVDCGWIIDNSALILVIISSSSLVVMTFLIVKLTYTYYVPELLLERLINQHENGNDKLKSLRLQAISKILNYSILTIDEPLAEKLWKFYFTKVSELRKGKENKEVIYPTELYYTFLEVNEILCEQNKRAISRFNNNTIFDIFLDNYQQTIISQETFIFLWKLILQALHYGREDFVISYWKKAHQLFSLSKKKIHPESDFTSIRDGVVKVKNKEEVEIRDKERSIYLEFHYALGGLLMYRQKYNILKQIMYFTQQEPPKYVLVPERMEEVIERYVNIDIYEYVNPVYYTQRYQFPDVDGVNSDSVITLWIKRYLTILFIRQYTLQEYYVTSNVLKTPSIPNNLSDLNNWLEEIKSLEYLLKDYLSNNKNTLVSLGFKDQCTPKWFEDNNKEDPFKLLDRLKTQIREEYKRIKTEQPIAKTKEKEFQESTVRHLSQVFQKYQNVFNNTKIEDYQSHYIGGRIDILDKSAFAEDQDVSYMDSDSITARGVVMEFEYYITNTFILMFPKKYFLTENKVFYALDRLNINSNEFVIISMGINLRYFMHLNIDGLEERNDKWYYNGFEIIVLDNHSNDLVSQSLFVLRKEDLPNIVFNEMPKDSISKYDLDKIDSKYNIYSKIIDLNNPVYEKLRLENTKNNDEITLSKSVLSCVNINVEVRYKPKAKCVQIKAFSQFDARGKANKLDDIEKF